MNSYPFACEITFRKEDDGFLEFDGYSLVGYKYWLGSAIEFQNDIWEKFVEMKEVNDLDSGLYFAYMSGKLVFDYSSGEYGEELDDIYPDVEYINIEKFQFNRQSNNTILGEE